MPDGASALQLVLGGDPALYAIVALSLIREPVAPWRSPRWWRCRSARCWR